MMKVLILRPDHIGDMLLTTPFLSVLKRAFPEWRVSVLCGSWSAPILENNPSVDDIIVCDYPWLARGTRVSWKTLIATIRRLRRQKFDIVFNLRKAAKAATVARAISGKQIRGFDVFKSAWAHTHKIHYRTDRHIADLYIEFVPNTKEDMKRTAHNGLELYLGDEELKSFHSKVTTPKRFAVCAPGAGYKEKFWLDDRWAQTADWITGRLNIPVVLTGTAGESRMARRICEHMNEKAFDMTGQLSIREVGILLQKALFAVSVDSAIMHIASAVQTPVVALFGPTNPVHWGPYPNDRTNRVVSKVKEFKWGRGSTNRSGGMELITVNDVQSAINEVCEAEGILS